MSESEITKVQLVIRKFLFETRDVVKDPQESMEWLSKFRDTLMYQDCEKEPCGYALTLLMEARKFNESQREKIQTRHARKALLDEGIENPSMEQIDRKRAEMYSDEETTEGAANGNNADVSATASTVDAPATPEDCKSLVSASLSMAGTSNNEAAVTTKNQRQRRTGGSIREAVNPLPPVRQSEPDVMSLAYSGEFGNVRLTQAQYNELGIRFGNLAKLNRAIDSLSCKIENGETNPRNHYAELVKWASYREDMEEQKIQQSEAPKMTEMEKSWIREAEKIARYEKELASNERR